MISTTSSVDDLVGDLLVEPAASTSPEAASAASGRRPRRAARRCRRIRRGWSHRSWVSRSVEEEEHELGGRVVEAEDQRGHDDDRDQHDDRGVDRLPSWWARRPSGARPSPRRGTRRGPIFSRWVSRGRRAPLAVVGRARLVGALLRHHALGLSVHRHGRAVLGNLVIKSSFAAGQEGLEPPTAGFGDRCSTN